MSVFDKLRDDADPWDGDPKPMVSASAAPVRRFPSPDASRRFNPLELDFAFLDTPDGPCVVFVPVDFWRRNRRPYPDHVQLSGPRPDFLEDEPDMECTWVIPDDLDRDRVILTMRLFGYTHNEQFEDALVAEMNGLRPP